MLPLHGLNKALFIEFIGLKALKNALGQKGIVHGTVRLCIAHQIGKSLMGALLIQVEQNATEIKKKVLNHVVLCIFATKLNNF
jgi:hypothetical protein